MYHRRNSNKSSSRNIRRNPRKFLNDQVEYLVESWEEFLKESWEKILSEFWEEFLNEFRWQFLKKSQKKSQEDVVTEIVRLLEEFLVEFLEKLEVAVGISGEILGRISKVSQFKFLKELSKHFLKTLEKFLKASLKVLH